MKTTLLLPPTLLLTALMTACTGIPKGVKPVENFKLDEYLGTWYEIARLDHSFEKGMSHVTASYEMRKDGGVSVINRGYLDEKQTWKQAEGKAYFVNTPDTGYLKVSFFGPFYGSYVIFHLDSNEAGTQYQTSYVSGPDKTYLWLLSRTPQVDESVYQAFKERAKKLGFDTSQLIRVNQTSPVGMTH